MKLFSHKFTILLSLSLIILFILIGLVLVPQKPQTLDDAHWSTFTNSDYGFQIRYPATWSISSSTPKDVVFSPNPKNTEEFIAVIFEENKYINSQPIKFYPLDSMSADSRIAFKGQDNIPSLTPYFARFVYKNVIYTFTYKFPNHMHDAIFLTLLSSFQPISIIRPTPTPILIPTPFPLDSSSWKNYTNTKYNFTFKYPASWGLKTKCETDPSTVIARLGPELLRFPDTDCGTANIPSAVMFYIQPFSASASSNYGIVDQKTFSSNNIPIQYYEYEIIDRSQSGSNTYHTFQIPLSNQYLFAVTGSYPLPSLKNDFLQILSTFKFTNLSTVKLYYPSNESWGINCESDIYREIQISTSQTPIADTLKQLVDSWTPTEYSFNNVKLNSNILTVTIDRTGFPGAGGSCNAIAHYTAVEKTALQFPQVKKVIIDPQVFQP